MSMTSRERVKAALNHQETDRVPVGEIGGGYVEEFVRAIISDAYRTDEDGYFHNHKLLRETLAADIMGARAISPNPDELVGEHPEWGTPVYRNFWGSEVTNPPDSTQQLVKPIAETPEELEKWEPPDWTRFSGDVIARWKRETDFFILATTNAGFDLGYEILGFERFMLWTALEPRVMRGYYEKLIETNIGFAKIAAKVGADAVLIADDLAFNSGPFVDPEYLRRDYFPLLKKQIQTIHDLGLPVIFHSDGDLHMLMDDLLDCGIDGLQSCDPNANMDIPALKQQYGERLTFMGNIDIDLLAQGTPQEVGSVTRDLIRDARTGGGFILSASNVITKYCKPENVLAMYAAVTEMER
ncbi:MAG: hypothetical protein K9N11_02615 [Lentisphaeria bacterium]|nr:hypothetical protein [Candidatus Neomarinimicrobiota bacterium]MCF7841723.1 hypothetical protein [Lentisphaeria bacterium]